MKFLSMCYVILFLNAVNICNVWPLRESLCPRNCYVIELMPYLPPSYYKIGRFCIRWEMKLLDIKGGNAWM